MTIREAEEIIKSYEVGGLRKPQSILGEKYNEIMKIHQTFKIIIDDIIRNPKRNDYLDSINGKRKMRRCGILKAKLLNKIFESYTIETKFGNGIFFDARKLFIGKEYPKWIKYNFCYANARNYLLTSGLDGKILSGIAFVGKPYLHSVVLVEDDIIDFNYDLVMSKDLYFALTHFEVLSEIDGKDLVENKKILRGLKGIKDDVFSLAFDDIIASIKSKIEDKNDVVGV